MSAAGPLAGARCLVTGAASGIGDAVARALADDGAEVVGLDRSRPTAELAQWVACDLASRASVEAVVPALGGQWDVVCHVAGLADTSPPVEVLSVNFLAPRLLTTLVGARLGAGATVLSVASVAGVAWREALPGLATLLDLEDWDDAHRWLDGALPGTTSYRLSKQALVAWSTRCASTWRGRGVRFNTVSPGVVDTPLLADFEVSMGAPAIAAAAAIAGRHGRPADVAPLVAFLASPAARWINGQDIRVDGGVSAALEVERILPLRRPE